MYEALQLLKWSSYMLALLSFRKAAHAADAGSVVDSTPDIHLSRTGRLRAWTIVTSSTRSMKRRMLRQNLYIVPVKQVNGVPGSWPP